jgi:hypothetical protein
MEDYYNNTYLYHIVQNPNKTPAPYNMWPDLFPFHQCNPINTFKCTITDANTNPHITINHFVPPNMNRNTLESIITPVSLLKPEELRFLNNANDQEISNVLRPNCTVLDVRNILYTLNDREIVRRINDCLIGITEELRNYIPPRYARDPYITGTRIRADRN